MICSRSACALAVGLMIFLAAAGEAAALPVQQSARSVSGQFQVTYTPNNSPFYHRPIVSTNTAICRLDAPLLAVAAEHFKAALRHELGISANADWNGKIFIELHSARSRGEPVFRCARSCAGRSPTTVGPSMRSSSATCAIPSRSEPRAWE